MSEFACRNGHLMSCQDHICKVCGSPVHTMDGMTGKQLWGMERDERRDEEIEEDE